MKKLALMFAVIGFIGISFGYKVIADEKENELVRVPLEKYLKGHATGDPEMIRQAFHKDARINAYRDGNLLNLSAEEFAGRFNGKAAPDESKRKRSIDLVEINGNAAIARITLDYPTVKFTDYMSLLKINGEWKIINKTFYADSKTAAK